MAEYCMLFAASAQPTQDVPHPLNLGLAQGRYHYPLLFKLLVSGQPRLSRSLLSDGEIPLAIAGDAAAGLAKLRAIRKQLQSGAAAAAIDDVIERLSGSHVQRLPILILEPAELLGCSPAPAETQLQLLLSEISALQVSEIARHVSKNFDPIDWPSCDWNDALAFEPPKRIEMALDPNATSLDMTPARLLESKSLIPWCKAGIVALKVDHGDPLIGKATEALADLSDLWALYYQGSCTRLPDEIGALKQLKLLSASDLGLRELPESLGSLRDLKGLDLSGNALSAFPIALRDLRLNTLTLNENRLLKIPDWIGEMKTLRSLRISGCMLSELPNGLFNLPALERLELSQNPLRQLPDSVGNLQCLRDLIIDNCQLETLPMSLGRLRALEFLYVHDNNFASIPEVIRRMPLRTLSIGGNPFRRHFWSRWALRARRVYFGGV